MSFCRGLAAGLRITAMLLVIGLARALLFIF